MHSVFPGTGQKSRVFDLWSLWKRYKLFWILFLVLWSVPQTNSSMERAIKSLSGTLLVAFHVGFLPISLKNRVFSDQMRLKKDSNGFSGGHYVMSQNSECFELLFISFGNSCGINLERLGSYQENHSKMPKTTFLQLLHSKAQCFHWKQVQKHTLKCNREKLAWANGFPSKNTQSNKIFIPHSKKLILTEWGVVPSPSFFSTPRPAREKRFGPSATSVFALAPKTMLLAPIYAKWGRGVGNTRFCSTIRWMEYGASINWKPRT